MNQILTHINDFLYTYILLFLLAGSGLYFTIRSRGVQLRLLKDGLKSLTEKKPGKSVSSFQALMISTASRVGTGNIAGIAAAITAGGPGAIFWMWVMAVIGSASAFVESTLAQIYKVKKQDGFIGGPSYYMQQTFHKRWPGVLFSISLILCFAYGFNGLQAYNISSSLEYYIADYSHTSYPLLVGILLSSATAFVIWGGIHRIGFITSVLVPVMATLYILIGLIVSILHISELPQLFVSIIKDAFDFRAVSGGLAGSAVIIGLKRGLFSNEAGMGSAPNAAASAVVAHPVNQGLVQVLSVFIDTILICTSTAMLLLLSGVESKPGILDGIPYVQAAMEANLGTIGIHFMTLSILTFAFTSIIGNYCYAEPNIRFIKNNKTLLHLFRCTCVAAVFLGTQANFSLMWNLADITMGIMAIINITALLFLNGISIRALKDYEKQKRLGMNPVFQEENIGVKATVWKQDR